MSFTKTHPLFYGCLIRIQLFCYILNNHKTTNTNVILFTSVPLQNIQFDKFKPKSFFYIFKDYRILSKMMEVSWWIKLIVLFVQVTCIVYCYYLYESLQIIYNKVNLFYSLTRGKHCDLYDHIFIICFVFLFGQWDCINRYK